MSSPRSISGCETDHHKLSILRQPAFIISWCPAVRSLGWLSWASAQGSPGCSQGFSYSVFLSGFWVSYESMWDWQNSAPYDCRTDVLFSGSCQPGVALSSQRRLQVPVTWPLPSRQPAPWGQQVTLLLLVSAPGKAHSPSERALLIGPGSGCLLFDFL